MELPKIFQIHDTQRTNPVYLDDCDIPAQFHVIYTDTGSATIE